MNKLKLNTKSLKKNLPFALIFLVGFLIAIYPVISQKYYEIKADEEVVEFKKKASELNPEEVERRLTLANAYNQTLDPSKLADPYTELEEEGIAEYARMLEIEEMIGHVEIPKIGQDLPIYAGTRESVLQKGCGHLEGTSLPVGGESTHTVITAHRGLPNALLFRNLDKLVEGDVFYIHNLGQTIAYKVDQILVVEPTDFDPVLVIEGGDYATLLTCHPYMINSQRLLVRGYRIPYQQAIDDGVANARAANPDFMRRTIIILPILLLVFFAYYNERRKNKFLHKEVESIEDDFTDRK